MFAGGVCALVGPVCPRDGGARTVNEEQLREIVACLERDRTIFYYFKDRYALLLLGYVAGAGRSLAEIRATPYGALLTKPLVKQVLARTGRSWLTDLDLASFWPRDVLAYRITFGRWPLAEERWSRDYHQMTRRGHNLVLQLNFAVSHNRGLHRLLGDEETRQCPDFHPVARKEVTLAWARIDLDLEHGEALVEEIQTDWIREVRSECRAEYDEERQRLWRRYQVRLLAPHVRLWDEAVLAAAIWLVRSEIGIRRIFFHTFETGNVLKDLGRDPPPRSLYTRLPRRFCFRKTHSGPLFLKSVRNRQLKRRLIDPATTWFVLEL